jgi:DNA helicase-2/ATP-dependent DNA helicase PcrA
MLQGEGFEGEGKINNVNELISAAVEYEKRCADTGSEVSLSVFLEELSLISDIDKYDEEADAVVLMTVHAAKGLEFPIVFLAGAEDGIFPSVQNMCDPSEMSEERRLAYVAITRAKRELYILHTRNRLLYGQTMYNPISRFVSEIPSKLIDKPVDPWEEEQSQRRAFTAQGGTGFGGRQSASSVYGTRGAQAPITQKKTYFSERSAANDITVGKPLTVTKKPNVGAQFKPGDRVKHMTFGTGEIISAKPMGADVLYEIIFDRVGTKKLMATYAKLTKI